MGRNHRAWHENHGLKVDFFGLRGERSHHRQ